MRRFMKGCAVLALIFAVLGFGLVFAGSAVAGSSAVSATVSKVTGGRFRMDFWNLWDSRYWEKQAEEITDRGDFSDGPDYDINDASMFDGRHEILSGDVEKFSMGNSVRNLEMDIGGCFFSMEPSEDGSVWVEAVNARKFQCYAEGDTLYIKTTGSNHFWSFGDGSEYVTLYLPEEYAFDEVDLSLGAGILSFESLKARTIWIEVGAGSVSGKDIRAEELNVEVGAGSIELTGMEVMELDAEAGMGEFVAGGAVDYARVECSMGNVELALDGNEEDYNYDLEASMGNITLGGKSFSGLAQEKSIYNHAGKNIYMSCSMGNITITFNGDQDKGKDK